eukprot:CAMPEP_0181487108 /NCGR_PEP_ID=MMETSP1110-20121109/47624_1 /TAXON_ID=174948 /ORGANISM="Symbiodinium sp., Strain CCMP421" /LENGTH=78 /DNA_ID=CAMNT_0023613555 /DNA_START=140 /DNA_END=376 /DNA_ORIENTATION=-
MAKLTIVAAVATTLVHEGAGLAVTKEMARRATRWQLCRIDGTLSEPDYGDWHCADCGTTFSCICVRSAGSTAMERVWL